MAKAIEEDSLQHHFSPSTFFFSWPQLTHTSGQISLRQIPGVVLCRSWIMPGHLHVGPEEVFLGATLVAGRHLKPWGPEESTVDGLHGDIKWPPESSWIHPIVCLTWQSIKSHFKWPQCASSWCICQAWKLCGKPNDIPKSSPFGLDSSHPWVMWRVNPTFSPPKKPQVFLHFLDPGKMWDKWPPIGF